MKAISFSLVGFGSGTFGSSVVDETNIQQIKSIFSDVFSKASGKGVGIRSSVSDAQEIVREIGALVAPESPAKVKLPAISRAVRRMIPDITDRRVRSLFNGEARIVDHYEMSCLKDVLNLEKAKRVRADFDDHASRIAAALAAQGAPLSRKQNDALRRAVRGVDGAGSSNSPTI